MAAVNVNEFEAEEGNDLRFYNKTNLCACQSGNFFNFTLSSISCRFVTQYSITIYVHMQRSGVKEQHSTENKIKSKEKFLEMGRILEILVLWLIDFPFYEACFKMFFSILSKPCTWLK